MPKLAGFIPRRGYEALSLDPIDLLLTIASNNFNPRGGTIPHAVAGLRKKIKKNSAVPAHSVPGLLSRLLLMDSAAANNKYYINNSFAMRLALNALNDRERTRLERDVFLIRTGASTTNTHVLGKTRLRTSQALLNINLNKLFYNAFRVPFEVVYYPLPALFLSSPRMTELAAQAQSYVRDSVSSVPGIVRWLLDFTLIFYASLFTRSTEALTTAITRRLYLEKK